MILEVFSYVIDSMIPNMHSLPSLPSPSNTLVEVCAFKFSSNSPRNCIVFLSENVSHLCKIRMIPNLSPLQSSTSVPQMFPKTACSRFIQCLITLHKYILLLKFHRWLSLIFYSKNQSEKNSKLLKASSWCKQIGHIV